MAYGNELVLEELVICCVAVGKKRLGDEIPKFPIIL
jgi:hypothetical protein